jgi:hypothetical protein
MGPQELQKNDPVSQLVYMSVYIASWEIVLSSFITPPASSMYIKKRKYQSDVLFRLK